MFRDRLSTCTLACCSEENHCTEAIGVSDEKEREASVQWFSSEQQASVQVDNLSLNIDDAEEQGDFNGDGLVDAADYTVWRDNWLSFDVPGDGDGDGFVGNTDYDVWTGQYGGIQPAASVAAPEPATASLVALLLAMAGGRRRCGPPA